MSIGIIGLPNVGKSTLFKALTKKEIDISNYPFCTIEPNTGIVSVPDKRLKKLADFFHSKKTIPAVIKFVDIAGLVKGANKGEGLGNQFLSHIREVDAIIHIVRVFEKSEIIHTEKTIDPLRDIKIINTELILKDMETIEKRISDLNKEIKSNRKEAIIEKEIFEKIRKELDDGKLIIQYLKENAKKLDEKTLSIINQIQFLTAKPIIYLLNSKGEELPKNLLAEIEKQNFSYLAMDAKENLEISELSQEEKKELGIQELNLNNLIKKSYQILNLITFFTTGEDETRAWTIKKDSKAPQAGGAIHSDFEEKFIKAEVIQWDKLLKADGFQNALAKGLIRFEGKDYIVQDGDVIVIKHGQ
jgi:GTP-binding protein YchF